MLNKEFQNINNAEYMFDEETNNAWDILNIKILNKESKHNNIYSFYYSYRPLLKIAASIIIFISISWFGLTLYHHSKTETIKTQDYQTNKILADGSTVYLNANSTIEVPKQFSSKIREVKLKGEAFFNVNKDFERPFIISVNDLRIEVLGTSFNVLARNQTEGIEVYVEDGTVSLYSVNNPEKLILTKNQYGLYKNKSLLRKEMNDLNYISWKTKLIYFKEAPLSYVIDVLNKTYSSNIIINDDLTSNFKLNAKFEEESLDTVLKSICLAFNLEQKHLNNNILLVYKNE